MRPNQGVSDREDAAGAGRRFWCQSQARSMRASIHSASASTSFRALVRPSALTLRVGMSNEASEPSSEVQTDISSSPMKNGRGCFSNIDASYRTSKDVKIGKESGREKV